MGAFFLQMSDWFQPEPVVADNNARRNEARRQREDAEIVRRLMADKNGRAWMHRLLDQCQIRGAPFIPGQPDTTAFRLGKQSIGWFLMDACEAFPDLYMMMLAEARQEEQREAALTAADERERQRVESVIPQQDDLPAPPGWTK